MPKARKVSPRASEHRIPTHTEPHVELLNALCKQGLICNSEVPFKRPGEYVVGKFDDDGNPVNKIYQVDNLIGQRFIVEVEGEGSKSRYNPVRDKFFTDKGYVMIHVSNEEVKADLNGTVKRVIARMVNLA